MQSIRTIFAIFRRDIRSASRDFILVFMLAAPFVLALVLRFLIPGVSGSTLRLAVDDTVDEETVAALNRYAVVTAYRSYEELSDRVAAADDVVGITWQDGRMALLLEGNEAWDASGLVLRMLDAATEKAAHSLRVTWSHIGDLRSPLAMYGLAGVLLMAVMMGGMMTGLLIIEEKEEFTLSAVNVTPCTRGQYIAGKCAVGVVVPLVQALALPFVMGVTGLHYGKLIVVTAASLSGGIVLGVTVGVMSPTQIAGIANMKFLMLVVSASYIGALVIPESYQYFLYAFPFYWSVRGALGVIWGTAAWGETLRYALWTLLLSGALLAALARVIRRGLSAMNGA